ncbi:MAG: acetate--CoA ligase [Halopseudomonas yangmingensis]|uniref:Propionyl-CoA synthetase n=1 Tax=Halopseudomonas yangmingensis TaxID=1720063 RepID=A0A1I4QMB3_9GAMM|nr:acetate--CoA ligase [Halopseudomonas yangmingensis]SFM40793.1 propionyl-CoA synthetase [Halopseudomonas yangmingensis]
MSVARCDYNTDQRLAEQDPVAFWARQAQRLTWFKEPQRVLDQDQHGHAQWFPDGTLNTAWLALDAQVAAGRGEQTALIWDSPVTANKERISYTELTRRVAQCAGMLRELGVECGDRVIIYMPMIPEAVISMLACARLGAVHCVVFGGFAAHELAMRIDDAEADIVLTASCGIEVDRIVAYKPLVDAALAEARHPVRHCVVVQRPQHQAELYAGRDLDWRRALANALPAAAVEVAASHPLYILYTSGTTGKPKGVVRDHGGHAVAMLCSMYAVYGMQPGDVFWAASDVGWVVGHSYIVYAPLLAGCTSILYEGKPVRTPDAGAFWRVCAEYQVKLLFAAPTAFRAIRKEDPQAEQLTKYDLSSLERIYLAGERLDPPTWEWLNEHLQRPVIDHWWQTETGWAIAANPAGYGLKPIRPGSAGVPMPGYQVRILDDDGAPVDAGQQGNICLQLPLPPGCLSGIWGNPERFAAGYLQQFPGHYQSGDAGYLDEQGYLYVMGRTDDIINVAGHRLSTGEMEEVLGSHPAVAECAVIGVPDSLKGELPLGLVVLRNGSNIAEEQLCAELRERIRQRIGALACFQKALIVERLPKTRSGKILRRTLRQMASGQDWSVPSTIEDPGCLDELQQRLSA